MKKIGIILHDEVINNKTYKILKLNGAIVSTEEISTDYYHALEKIIKKQ